MIKAKKIWISTFLIAAGLAATPTTFACTRVLLANTSPAVMVGRNMDWLEDMQANLWVYPRGLERSGLIPGNALKWTAKYGSIVATVFDDTKPVTTDGMNERGLAAHILSLAESDYGKRNETLPGISVLMWAQFYLDNFATVDEAVRYSQTNSFQLIPFFYPKFQKWINLHLALEDASGDSAVIEYVNGVAHVYHDRSYRVLTNSPVFDQQLENLKQYRGFGGNNPLPGSTVPADRFVRATYYSTHLPVSTTVRDELTTLVSVMQNASQPFGVPSEERPKVSQTIWGTVADLTNRVYYFKSSSSFNMIWTSLDKFNLSVGAPILKLDLVHQPDKVGDVSNDFKPVT